MARLLSRRRLLRVSALGGSSLAAWAAWSGLASRALWGEEAVSTTGGAPQEHPLAHPMRLLAARHAQIQREVQDYTCVLVKRERIGGVLQEQQQIFVKVRRGSEAKGALARPFAVYLEFLRPERLRDRRVLFVEGRYNNRLLVRKGGARLSEVAVRIDPNSDAARRESLNPITDLGFDRMAASLMRRLKQDAQAGPTGANTRVEYFNDAKLNKRPCLCIRVTHSNPQADLYFHVAHLFLDDEHQLPVRIDAYDWPQDADSDPPLVSEFTYTNLKLNVGLTDADFRPSVISDDL
jgi:hypothetical protein